MNRSKTQANRSKIMKPTQVHRSQTNLTGRCTSLNTIVNGICRTKNRIVKFYIITKLRALNRSKFNLITPGSIVNTVFAISTIIISLTTILSINTTPASAATSTLNLTLSDSNVTMNIAPTSTNGSFSKSSTSTISASTNNATGYTLSIAASSSSTNASKLINTSDPTSALNSITSATTEEQFKALSATTYNNMWGYLPSKYCSDGTSTTCTTNTSFLPAPSISGDILDQTSTANTTANNYTIAIGARIDSTTKTGSYANSFIVKLVANAIPYTITYIDDSISNMPIDVDTTTPDTSVNISSTAPTRNGYTFIGWCTVTPTINADGTDTCSGTKYNAGATIAINQTGTNNNFTLHAMWSENYSIAHVTYMQDFASMTADKRSKVILSMVPELSYTLKDNRDETTYHIAKLKDGNVWLQDNLALDLTDSTVLNSMSSSNTNASDISLGYLRGTTTRNPSTDPNGNYATAGVVNWTSSYSHSAPLVNLTNKDVIPTDAISTAGGYKVGGYYNYCAASAGSYCYGNGTNCGTVSGNATEDICPNGWRMPTGTAVGEYQVLYNNNSYNTYLEYRSILHLPLSGNTFNGSVDAQGSSAGFWSSTHCGTDNFMCQLVLATNNVAPYHVQARNYGNSVRCMLGS